MPKTWQLGFAPGHGQLVRHLSAKGFKPDEMVQANVALSNDGGKLRDRFLQPHHVPHQTIRRASASPSEDAWWAMGEPKYLNSQETPLFHKSQVLYGYGQGECGMARRA